MSSRDLPKIVVRLPRDVKQWLAEEAANNASSQTSEIVRAVRERMQRVQTESWPPSEGVRQSLKPKG
jgi:Arc-like DNA binding domain